MTISQGKLLMKLIDREVGKSSYMIIKDFKNSLTAGFWQGIAKLFGSDLKKPYDPEGEDAKVEELVKIWEAGDFPAFYFSLFWKDPPEVIIPEKFRRDTSPVSESKHMYGEDEIQSFITWNSAPHARVILTSA